MKKIDSSDNVKINFYFILAMQILGKGLHTMSICLGLLGIHVSEGNYKVWKKIQDKVDYCNSHLQNNVVQKTYKRRLRQALPQAFCLQLMDESLLLAVEILGAKVEDHI